MKFDKILVTGGNGFLGKQVVNQLKITYPNATIVTFSSKEIDLRNQETTFNYFQTVKPDLVIALAARLGGIGDNRNYPASYFYDNIMIGVNTIEASRLSGVKKLINIGTVCSYPKITPVPFVEEDLWNGYPEPTNGAYGISKKAVGEYSIAVEQQYGLKVVNLLMTNLYGPGDDFRDATSHVIPALIKKVVYAKNNNLPRIEAWGDGSPTRDFIYIEDAAKGIVQSIEHKSSTPINIGSGQEYSIKKLYENICDILDFKGEVYWDTSKPNGQPKRLLNIDKAKNYFGFNPSTSFYDGLKNTIHWYLQNQQEIDNLPKKFNH